MLITMLSSTTASVNGDTRQAMSIQTIHSQPRIDNYYHLATLQIHPLYYPDTGFCSGTTFPESVF
jgi:hypothetical protein